MIDMDYFEKDLIGNDIVYKPTKKGAVKSKKYIENAVDDMCDYVKKWEKTGKKRGYDFGKNLILMRNDDGDFDLRLEEYMQKATSFNYGEYKRINLAGVGAMVGAAAVFPPAILGAFGSWLLGTKLDERKQKNRVRRMGKVFKKLRIQ